VATDDDLKPLADLARTASEAQAAAVQHPPGHASWQAWRDAAAVFQQAVTDASAGDPTTRYALEMAAKKLAREGG
jgi:hypothetical protein